ncbi:penicillin acylase family protein [Schumannella soli]|uniref:penicillin acylase family protein n=1 Tax=Schumannella soli TaxID=2590779 RepID=UPI0015E860BA|nr:penicillin acylase family protein [Schumannella soli]
MTRAELFRDAQGVPHLRAADALALAHAQGRVTAHDRGWQIEVDRLRAEGRLASLIGEAGLAWDVFAHRARLDDTARRAHAALDPATREWVDAYSAGVRDGMDERGAAAPEFALLDAHFGERRDAALDPWPDHAPLGVLHVAHALFGTFPLLLWRQHVAHALSDATVDLFVGGGAGSFSDSGDPDGSGRSVGSDGDGPGDGDPNLPTAGSNAWALHGSRTASGLPLLAGDPHRLLELPGVYQQVRLACPEFDVVGLAFPGVPGVPHFGHSGDAAWGITNAMAHGADLFRELLRAVDARGASARHGGGGGGGGGESTIPGSVGSADAAAPVELEALGPDGWEPVTASRVTIEVRGADPIELVTYETARGPIVTELVPVRVAAAGPAADASTRAADASATADRDAADDANTGTGTPAEFIAYSLRTPARVDADLGVSAIPRLLRARTADDVVAAFSDWVDPVNRLLAADRHGAVRSAVVGRAPDRPRAQRRLPLDASREAVAPNRAMPVPVAVEPATGGIAVDANERPADPARDLGLGYPSANRARRIRELVDAGHSASPDTAGPVWADVRLSPAETLRSLLESLGAEDRAAAGVAGSGATPLGAGGAGDSARESDRAGASVSDAAESTSDADAPPVFDSATPLSAAARALRAELLGWSGDMDADSPAAAAFAGWRSALVARVADAPALAALHRPHGFGAIYDPWFSVRGHVAGALPRLLADPGLGLDAFGLASAALEDAALKDAPHADAARADVASGAPTAHAAHPTAPPAAGGDGDGGGDDDESSTAGGVNAPAPTRAPAPTPTPAPAPAPAPDKRAVWGDTHRAHPLHVLADVPGLDLAPLGLPTLDVPLAGDGDTVRCTAAAPGVSDRSWRTSVARWAWDLADRGRSRWGVPFGAAGDPASPHFADQLDDWASARTVPVVTDWARLAPDSTFSDPDSTVGADTEAAERAAQAVMRLDSAPDRLPCPTPCASDLAAAHTPTPEEPR